MTDLAIRVEELSKLYHIGGRQKTYDRLGDQLFDWMAAPLRRAGNLLKGQAGGASELDETIWALKDVSLEIKPGEVVGIIGRNGAGKSTLLKILSRITEPTMGYADIYGRVGSLLEVGTGFHPELTGRENIYLNGAILGMKKVEINQKFDEIVAFAEIDKFLDTPVKHYSSGMYVRLAFSVAAHLEPEVLLVDEVLAVGDVAFQRKCLGKMEDVGKQGRTVLFVSHNMGLMQTLCQNGVYLNQGQIAAMGSITQTVNAYLKTLEDSSLQNVMTRKDRRGAGKVRLTGVEISSGASGNHSVLKTGQPARFSFHFDQVVPGLYCEFFIYDQVGNPVIMLRSKERTDKDILDPDIGNQFICDIEELLLLPGRYRLDVVFIGDNLLQDAIQAATFFEVGEGDIDGRPTHADKRFRISVPHQWILPKLK